MHRTVIVVAFAAAFTAGACLGSCEDPLLREMPSSKPPDQSAAPRPRARAGDAPAASTCPPAAPVACDLGCCPAGSTCSATGGCQAPATSPCPASAPVACVTAGACSGSVCLVPDLSGNGNLLTLLSPAALAPGRALQALSTNLPSGAGCPATTTDGPKAVAPGLGFPSGDAAATYELWVKTTVPGALVAHGDRILAIMPPTCSPCAPQDVPTLSFAGCTKARPGINVADGNWHFVAATYESGRAALYLDGALLVECIAGPLATPAAAKVALGSEAGVCNALAGAIDSVRVSAGVLAAADIRTDWTQADLRVTERTAALWTFDGSPKPLACCPAGASCGPSGTCLSAAVACPAGVACGASCCAAGEACVSNQCVRAAAGVGCAAESKLTCGSGKGCCAPSLGCAVDAAGSESCRADNRTAPATGPDGPLCAAGRCASGLTCDTARCCPPGTSGCGGECCESGVACQAGVCACPTGETACGAVCCPGGYACTNGQCVGACPSDYDHPCSATTCCYGGDLCRADGSCGCPSGHPTSCQRDDGAVMCCLSGAPCDPVGCGCPPGRVFCFEKCCDSGQACDNGSCVAAASVCPDGLVASTAVCYPNGSTCSCAGESSVCISRAQFQADGIPLPSSCAPEGTVDCIAQVGTTQRLVLPCCPGLVCKVGASCGQSTGHGNGACQQP